MSSLTRLVMLAALALAAVPASGYAGQTACTISGVVTGGRVPLPGAVLTLSDSTGKAVGTTSSAADGRFALTVPGQGDYRIEASLFRFAPFTRALTIDAANCQVRTDLALTLASRTEAAAAPPPGTAPIQRPFGGPGRAAGAGGPGSPNGPGARAAGQVRRDNNGRPSTFQALPLVPDQQNDPTALGESPDTPSLPAGFSLDTATEAVATVGTARAAEGMGPGERFDLVELRDGGGGFGPGGFGGGGFGGGFAGGPGGFQGGPGGPGGGPIFFAAGPFGGGRNQIRGSISDSLSASALDSSPFSLNGRSTTKAPYFQQRIAATLGGPLRIPGLYKGDGRTTFFINYTGDHSRNPFDAWTTVPTAEARSGDLSALGVDVRDPLTGASFANGVIPASRLDRSAQALLALFPLPNEPGATRNYHYVTTNRTNNDDVNVRFVRTFGGGQNEPPAGGPRVFGPGGGGPGFGPPGIRLQNAAGRAVSNLTASLQIRRTSATSAGNLPTLGGSSSGLSWNVPASYSSTIKGFLNNFRVQFNGQRRDSANLYQSSVDIAGEAGLVGVSTDPFAWGAPNLSFATISSLSDAQPSHRLDRLFSIGDTVTKTIRTHTISFGADFRLNQVESRVDANARGSYVFSGVNSGSDFGDFLLGLPQQASVQYGAGLQTFSAHATNAYVQDDWRLSSAVTINAGLRYEYQSPYREGQNRLVTLDFDPALAQATAVQPGDTGANHGLYSDTIVDPDRNNVAPRVGIAWRARPGTVVRGGYGLGYNLGVYQRIAQQLATQPPFSTTSTIISTTAAPLALATALAQPSASTPNTFAVDPGFTLPYVQNWNIDFQRELRRTFSVGIGYIGSKGSNLELVRAPNRTAQGLRNPNLPAFLLQTSGAESTMNGLTLRLRKRASRGVGFGLNYTLSKSRDNASSIGGGGTTIAQDDQNLDAEWGLSSFDQRHRFNGDLMLGLPFGPDRRWIKEGFWAAALRDWNWNVNVQLASGTPFTARILSSATDVAGGTNGTLRANYDGAAVAVDDPTTERYFNTSAFSVPAAGTYGNAARNTIVGPGTSNVTMRLTRSIPFDRLRVLSVDVVATNVFNTPQYSAIDTVVNSPTFGQVTAARAPRRVQILLRMRF